MGKITYMTKEGLDKLKAELEHLINVERPAISQQIGDARDKGDLSENAEYDAAKEAQGLLEMKISQLKEMLSNAKIIDESQIDTSKVQFLTTVKVQNKKTNKPMSFTIVSDSEVDIKNGKISIGTPIAKALFGKKVGDVVSVNIPAGTLELEILEITI